jgi:hypothetical protein
MARYGTLPPDFKDWWRSDENGQTVAHVAVLYYPLPPDFKDWAAVSNGIDGVTVAHYVIFWGHRLPESFDQWDLADKNGSTVAHLAAELGLLPENFDQWDLADNDGETVRDVYERWRAANA